LKFVYHYLILAVILTSILYQRGKYLVVYRSKLAQIPCLPIMMLAPQVWLIGLSVCRCSAQVNRPMSTLDRRWFSITATRWWSIA